MKMKLLKEYRHWFTDEFGICERSKARYNPADGRVYFGGPSGSHSVAAFDNGKVDTKRINAHWKGFCSVGPDHRIDGRTSPARITKNDINKHIN